MSLAFFLFLLFQHHLSSAKIALSIFRDAWLFGRITAADTSFWHKITSFRVAFENSLATIRSRICNNCYTKGWENKESDNSESGLGSPERVIVKRYHAVSNIDHI
jgi:hypothetical protein